MHEHLDEMGVIHMNGRIYDPLIGRFMSADPFIQAPENLQSHNRFAYVMNNPLSYTDPSGYFSLKKFFRTVLAIAAVVVLGPGGYAPFFSGTGLAAGLGNAALAGFVSGAIQTGTLKGAIQGAFSGMLFFGVGEMSFLGGAGGFGKVIGHAVAGCVSSVASGGQCGSGALAAGFGEAVGPHIKFDSRVANVVARSVLGGIGSVLGGGKFENGAVTAAFGYLFNECGHGGCGWGDTKVTITGNYAAGPVGQYGTYPSSLHLEIRIENGYDTITIEGQPGSYSVSKGLRLVTGSDNPHPAPVFSMELPVPKGMSMQQLATNLVEAARAYQNNLPYNFPLAGTGTMMWGYNSNSHVSGVLQRATGQYQSGVVDAARRAGFLVPGFSRPIPIGP